MHYARLASLPGRVAGPTPCTGDFRSVKKPGEMHQFKVRLPDDLAARVSALAATARLPVSTFLRAYLSAHLGGTTGPAVEGPLVPLGGTAGPSGGVGGGTSLTSTAGDFHTQEESPLLVLQEGKTTKPKPSKAAHNGKRTSWLEPYRKVWLEVMQADPPFGIMAKALIEVHKRHGPRAVAEHLRNYLQSTEARFVSLPRFAVTFGAWAQPADPWTPRPGDVEADGETLTEQGFNRMMRLAERGVRPA